MVSLYDILIISLIVLVIFLIICVVDFIKLLKGLQDVIKTNKQPLQEIMKDVSKLTNDTVTFEDNVKNYFVDLLAQFIKGKEKGEKSK